MKLLKINILIAVYAFLLNACGREEFADYSQSPVKSVECYPQLFPLASSDGTVLFLEDNDNTYQITKIDAQCNKTSKTFALTFPTSQIIRNYNDNYNNSDKGQVNEGGENQSEIPQSKYNVVAQQVEQEQFETTTIELSNGTFRKNLSDEFYFDYYSTNNFGRVNYAVVKFDKNCNVLFQIDSTVNAMGSGGGASFNTTVTKVPVMGVPLNNGGYVMILQTPTMTMPTANTDYNVTMRIINSDGKLESDIILPFDESISITGLYSLSDNILLYYQTSSYTGTYQKLYSLSGEELKYDTQDNNIVNYSVHNTKNSTLFCGYDFTESKNFVKAYDSLYNQKYILDSDSAVLFSNAVNIDETLLLCGFMFPTTTNFSSLSSLLQFLSSCSGIILEINVNDIGLSKSYITTYDDGTFIYAAFKVDNGYNVFLSRQNSDAYISSSNTLGDRIYVYHVDKLENLVVN